MTSVTLEMGDHPSSSCHVRSLTPIPQGKLTKLFWMTAHIDIVHQSVYPCSFFFLFFLRSPAISLGFTIFGWDFCVCDPFFNPTIKVVIFRLRGWCVLGVYLLGGIHLSWTWTSGSFESVRWNVCVHRPDLGLYSHPKEFLGEWSLNPC